MAERNAYAASNSKSPLPRSSQSQSRYPPGGGGSFTFLGEDQDNDAFHSSNSRYRRDAAASSRPSSRSTPSYNAVSGYMQGQPPLRSPTSKPATSDAAPPPRARPRGPGLPSRSPQGIGGLSGGGIASSMGIAPRPDYHNLDRDALRASLDSGLAHHEGDQGGYRPAMAWGTSDRPGLGASSSGGGMGGAAPPVRAAWTSHGLSTHSMSNSRASAAVRPSTGSSTTSPLSPPSVWGELRAGTGTSRGAAFQVIEEDTPSAALGGTGRIPTASSERHARGGARRAPFTRSRPSASHGGREQWTDGSESSGMDAGAHAALRGSGEEGQLDREGRGAVTRKGRGARSANYLTRGAGPRGINTISLSSSVTNRGIEEESIGLEISLSDYMAALETTPAPSSATPASQELWGDLDMSVARSGAEGPSLVIQGGADAADLELAVRGLSLRGGASASSSGAGGISTDEYYGTSGSISNSRNPVSPNGGVGDWASGGSPAPRPFTSSKNRTVSPASSSGRTLSPRDDPLSPGNNSSAARTLSPTGPPKLSDGAEASGYGGSSGAAATAGGASSGSGSHLPRPLRSARSYGHPPSEIETGVGRPPSRQRPPPEALHLFVENQGNLAAAVPARSRPPSSTSQLQPSPRDSLEAERNALASRQSTARMPERSPRGAEPNGRGVVQRPPSRQRPPPEALCLDMSSPWGRFQDIYIDSSGSDMGSP